MGKKHQLLRKAAFDLLTVDVLQALEEAESLDAPLSGFSSCFYGLRRKMIDHLRALQPLVERVLRDLPRVTGGNLDELQRDIDDIYNHAVEIRQILHEHCRVEDHLEGLIRYKLPAVNHALSHYFFQPLEAFLEKT